MATATLLPTWTGTAVVPTEATGRRRRRADTVLTVTRGCPPPHGGHAGHQGMLKDLRNRFIVSALVTVPIPLVTLEVQELFGYSLTFSGDQYVLLVLSTFVYLYGGWPFLKGVVRELRARTPGMMTLVAVAISAAYFYSAASVLDLGGSVFFWELATLMVIMLLGHWVEMRSVMGASRALEEPVRMLPSEAHLVREGRQRTFEQRTSGPAIRSW